MRIAVVGTGYVGLVSGVCLANFGHQVVGIDKDAAKIAALRDGRVPFFEPGLGDLVAANVAAGRLRFTDDLAEGVADAEVVFIAVGTPSMPCSGMADLSYVYRAAHEIAEALADRDGFVVVVDKSTVPVGTGDVVEKILRRRVDGCRFAVVSNPEFLREGVAIGDFCHPDRIVIGLDDPAAEAPMRAIYAPLEAEGVTFLYTSRRSAELVKYAANVFLAMKVTFINEIAELCDAVGGDVRDVARGVGLDRRIGESFLKPGPGFGGSCFPKDTQALIQAGREAGAPVRLVETLVAVNEARKLAMAEKIAAACGGSLDGKTIAVWGLTFKPDTDDMRDAPSLTIVPALQDAGARVVAFDPEGMTMARALLPGVEFADDPLACAKGASALVLITEWAVFSAVDFGQVKDAMRDPTVVDLRNIFDGKALRNLGFRYCGVGLGPIAGPPAIDAALAAISEELGLSELRAAE
jgi:UDPglucose 6-dehydrogenase